MTRSLVHFRVRKLDEAGVDVTAVRYEGLIHDYGLLNWIDETERRSWFLYEIVKTV